MASVIDELPDLFLSQPKVAKAISAAVKQGKLRKVASRLYTKNLLDDLAQYVRRNLWRIAGLYFPGAVVVDRTALELKPSADGSIFLAHERAAEVEVGPIVLRSRVGRRLETDLPFGSNLHLSSRPRALLDNMVPSRTRQRVARTLNRAELERWLDEQLRIGGEQRLNALRDEARPIAVELDRALELDRLTALIGTLLGSHDVPVETDVARARIRQVPYDPRRVALMETLRTELLERPLARRPDASLDAELPNLAFFEAYFSNFIEGTRFSVEEATAIVFEGRVPPQRPDDAHDVLGTFVLVSSRQEMMRVPRSTEELHRLLRARHAEVMRARPEKSPGLYKTQRNQAGTTVFVEPELVLGTLDRGFDLYTDLVQPLQRAIFMMCLVSEVHPFADGNGRVARIMMNAELVAGGERRIIIPTVYRNNYLAALKGLSHNGLCEPIIRVLDFAQRYTAAIDFSELARAEATLRATNAFVDPALEEAGTAKLVLPPGAR